MEHFQVKVLLGGMGAFYHLFRKDFGKALDRESCAQRWKVNCLRRALAWALCEAGVILEEETSIGKIPPLGCPVGKSVGMFLVNDCALEGPDHFG